MTDRGKALEAAAQGSTMADTRTLIEAVDAWKDARKAAMENVSPATFAALADAEAGLLAASDGLVVMPPMIRMILLDDVLPGWAVCVGGRWDMWLFCRYPDGQWVSHMKLKEEAP